MMDCGWWRGAEKRMDSLTQARGEEVDEHACGRDVLGVVDDELDVFQVLVERRSSIQLR